MYLIQMRDGQSYRSAGYRSFEEYCKSKAGLSIRDAQRKINLALVFQSMGDISVAHPETPEQVLQLSAMAGWQMEERDEAIDSLTSEPHLIQNTQTATVWVLKP